MNLNGSRGVAGLALAIWIVFVPGISGAEDTLETGSVRVVQEAEGFYLEVEGKPFLIKGMNWGYMPVGQNYRYNLWAESDAFIEGVLEEEMGQLKSMGVNAIRLFSDVPPQWISHIYQRYQIYTVVNHLFGRYGFIVGGTWVTPIDYSNETHRNAILDSVMETITLYKDTPGVLLYLLGNENNYGLEWSSFEIENLPKGERALAKATYLYSLYGEAVDRIHEMDTKHPVSIANGDIQYLSLIVKHVPNLDILGTNVYRGKSVGDLYARVSEEASLPVLYSEFGCDAYDAKRKEENPLPQAKMLLEQWREIYEESWGKGSVGNALGGFTFQWSDGWWKYKQQERLDVHDANASWANGGYSFDFVEGQNNMNEEWWGITAKGRPDKDGRYKVIPRPAFYALQQAYTLDPFMEGLTREAIGEHFDRIQPENYVHRYVAGTTAEKVATLEKLRLTQLRMRLETITSGGFLRSNQVGNEVVFDHMESFYLGVGLYPVENFRSELVLNVLGNVAANPIDEIYYERRGLRQELVGESGKSVVINDAERVKVYSADFEWEEAWVDLHGFYRTGHYHWGYEGDFFGFYPEANYGPNIDIYDADAPLGMELKGKKGLEGFKVAFGPQLYWGANPSILSKYHYAGPVFQASLLHQEDVAKQESLNSSRVVPEPITRKTAVHMGIKMGALTWDIGGLVAGMDRVGTDFISARDASGESYLNSGYAFVRDTIHPLDGLGAKTKVTLTGNGIRWYAQGGYQGIVADGGPDQTLTFTGWRMKADGRGNQVHGLTGFAVDVGPFQMAPNVLYQKPLEAALPTVADQFSAASGNYYPGTRPRNILDDPFAVLGNRETIGLELLLVYDPTPGTWFWAWDNLIQEDASFAMSLDGVYRIQPTGRDSGVGFSAEGALQPFHASPPAVDEWELHGKWVSNPGGAFRLAGDLLVGSNTAKSGGSDDLDRLVLHYGATARMTWRQLAMETFVKIDDWGPYDYHRDYNLTYPIQAMGDVSWALIKPKWLFSDFARLGVRYLYRTLDQYSNRFAGRVGETGNEFEVRTYVDISL